MRIVRVVWLSTRVLLFGIVGYVAYLVVFRHEQPGSLVHLSAGGIIWIFAATLLAFPREFAQLVERTEGQAVEFTAWHCRVGGLLGLLAGGIFLLQGLLP
jgi:hypothetical protein